MSMKTKQCKCASCAGGGLQSVGARTRRPPARLKVGTAGINVNAPPPAIEKTVKCGGGRRALRCQPPAFNRTRTMRGVPSEERSHEYFIC